MNLVAEHFGVVTFIVTEILLQMLSTVPAASFGSAPEYVYVKPSKGMQCFFKPLPMTLEICHWPIQYQMITKSGFL